MTRRVTIVSGPPCAGKSHYVTTHAQPDDLVICLDTLAQQAGSERTHNHEGRFYGLAEREFRRLCSEVWDNVDAHAWVIRCAPQGRSRRMLAYDVEATGTVLLMPPITLALDRARDRENYAATARAIQRWYRRYTPDPGDTVITEQHHYHDQNL